MATMMMIIMIGLLLLGFPMMIPLITAAAFGFVMMFDGFDQMGTFVQQMMGGIRPASLIAVPMFIDRKSTRLNSSHVKTSYAVLCLTKHNGQRDPGPGEP